MASPNITATPYELLKIYNGKFKGIANRSAYIHEESFRSFWGDSVDDAVASAIALNQFAEDSSTEELPQTAASLFSDHSAFAQLVAAITPNTQLSKPPIDMATIFTDAGAIDIDLFRETLESL